MILRRIFPSVDAPVAVDSPEASAAIDALYAVPARDWLRLNLVASIDGSAVGADGTSQSLTRGADRKVLGAIRRTSDVVLVGASSVRAEGYRLPRTAPLAVVTASGDLAGSGLPREPVAGRLIVLCPASAQLRVRESLDGRGANVLVVPDAGGCLAAREILAALNELGLRSIVCEGGPRLAAQLIAAGLVDELCLSTSPVLGGPAVPVLGPTDLDPVRLELAQLLVDDAGVSYARWSMSRPPTSPRQPSRRQPSHRPTSR